MASKKSTKPAKKAKPAPKKAKKASKPEAVPVEPQERELPTAAGGVVPEVPAVGAEPPTEAPETAADPQMGEKATSDVTAAEPETASSDVPAPDGSEPPGDEPEAAPSEALAPTDSEPAESEPPAERTQAETPKPFNPGTAAVPGQPKKLSAIDAAARVLAEAAQPMTCPEMIAAMTAKGYWTSPGGKTPASTLYSAILREIKVKEGAARFQKTERGRFAARG